MIKAQIKKKLGNFFLDAVIEDSGFICISGKNGSGKTSLLNCIAGVYKIDQGKIVLNSRDITEMHIEKRGAVLVTYNSYIQNLSVTKHLLLGLKQSKLEARTLDIVKERLGINFDGTVRDLSLGNKLRVSLATALLSKPNAILVDEVFTNLDNKQDFVFNFKNLANDLGIDVLYTTQHKEDVYYAEHSYVLENGKSRKEF